MKHWKGRQPFAKRKRVVEEGCDGFGQGVAQIPSRFRQE